MKKLSVVILNWNGAKMLRQFLPSVTAHSKGEGIEVCVADNASTDNSLEVMHQEFPDVRLILLDKNYGFAEGYNRALAEVNAEYSLLLNSDVEVTDGWLAPMLEYMDAHPDVAACQPKIRSWHRREEFEHAGACGGFIDKYGYPFCRGRMMSTVEADEGQYDTTVPIFWATGAALLVRTADYRKVGGLDSRFFAHMEEIDLCWRLRSRGRSIVCIPQSVVYHVGGATLNKENPRKTYLNFRNNLLMLYKNLPEDELRPVMRIRWCLDMVAALQYLLKGEWGNVRAVFRARKDYCAMRPSYQSVRAENLSKTIQPSQPERFSWSLLWRYYMKGVKRFRELR
ncbi:MAG: glycosyltransferase family 2 protein [Bacteroidaceae bacterium]|nr:glycosyltransferase family 2 protein [Bacteroidaceae bacterium]